MSMTDQPTGGTVLLDETEFDPEIADIAGKAARDRLRKRKMAVAHRHDIDFGPRVTSADDVPSSQ